MPSWLSTLIASAVVVVSAPAFALLFPGLWEAAKQRISARTSARRLIARQLDPLLKAADELQGKLLSLAKEDFTELWRPDSSKGERSALIDLHSIMYLFAQFWCRLEILRRESFHAELSRDRRGAMLQKLVDSLESKRIRLVDRAWQRAMGECLIISETTATETMTFREFVNRCDGSPEFAAWFAPLSATLSETKYKKGRQRILQYGVVVHVLIDSLDPQHRTTHNRPGYPSKLSRRAKKDLVGRVFGQHLPTLKKAAAKYVS